MLMVKYYLDDEITVEDMGRECGYVWGRRERHDKFFDGQLKEISHLEDEVPF